MRRTLAALGVVAAVALAGCGGPQVEQTRAVGSFDRLEVAGGVHVEVAQGERPGVTVSGREDVLDRVTTEAEGGTLRVAIHDRGIVIGPDPLDDVRVRVTSPRLEDIRASGHGDIDLGEVHADALRFDVSGAADLRARGEVGTLEVQIHGAADADFRELRAREARVVIHGAADIGLDVTDRLDVEIHGAGDVSYTGDPVVTKQISGAGEVSRASL